MARNSTAHREVVPFYKKIHDGIERLEQQQYLERLVQVTCQIEEIEAVLDTEMPEAVTYQRLCAVRAEKLTEQHRLAEITGKGVYH